MIRLRQVAAGVCLAAMLGACATTGTTGSTSSSSSSSSGPSTPLPAGLAQDTRADPYPSTYRALPSQATAIVGATVFTATGQVIQNGTVLMRDGKIERVEAGLAAPSGYAVIDGTVGSPGTELEFAL